MGQTFKVKVQFEITPTGERPNVYEMVEPEAFAAFLRAIAAAGDHPQNLGCAIVGSRRVNVDLETTADSMKPKDAGWTGTYHVTHEYSVRLDGQDPPGQ